MGRPVYGGTAHGFGGPYFRVVGSLSHEGGTGNRDTRFIGRRRFVPSMQGQEIVAPPPLGLSPAAVDRIRFLRTQFERPQGGLRHSIIAGGCSGTTELIELASTQKLR